MKRVAVFLALFSLLALSCNTVLTPSPLPPESPIPPAAEQSLEAEPTEPQAATAETDIEPTAATEQGATLEPAASTATVEPSLPAQNLTAEPSLPAPTGVLNPNPPEKPVKLIFIHHSSGGNWLADPAQNDSGGDLGRALMENNYFVSATNYGWGPDGIGDRTDIGNWWEWFRSDNSAAYLQALYGESGTNFGDFGSWPRLAADPGGENEIVVFKSCFPNSALGGKPDDPPQAGENPLQSQDSSSEAHTVANAKGIYVGLLDYFAAHPDKLFVVITAPPLYAADTSSKRAANARAFNRWLVEDWLKDYSRANVAVFDFYNVLTSNGGKIETNDLGRPGGNHHRFRDGSIEYIVDQGGNTSAYAVKGDSHPNAAGNQKATGEFVPLLNIFYHRWRESR